MARRRGPRKLSMLALLTATYCMVSGGPFGLEDIIGKSGYLGGMVILLVTPLIWSLPTALMVSELSSALPEEGGFYTWVTRGLGPFWGFQEAWLTLVGSMFDMAIYPALFAMYAAKLVPALGAGHLPLVVGTAFVAAGTAWNLFSAGNVGRGAMVTTSLMAVPFLILMGLGLAHVPAAGAPAVPAATIPLDLLGGIMIAMWNYMGWDNASTVAAEVDQPRRAYPRAMLWGVAVVTLSYVIPVGVMALARIDLSLWTTGGWVDIAQALGGAKLAAWIMVAGAIANFDTFNTLMMSLVRLPMVMAADGFLPRVMARTNPRTGVPVIALVVCAATWAGCQCLGFLKVVMLSVLISGLSMLLEFVALMRLRITEPGLRRPFRVPGGLWGTVLCGIGPTALILLSCVRTATEEVGTTNELVVGVVVVVLGPLLYVMRPFRRAA